MIGNPYPQFQNVQEWNDFVNEVRHVLAQTERTLEDVKRRVLAGEGGYDFPLATDEEAGVLKLYGTTGTSEDGTITQKGITQAINDARYTLPSATTTQLGGVKIGDRLTVDENGLLSADDQSYTLPTASDSVLGGIKIGEGLNIDENGVVSSDSGGAANFYGVCSTAADVAAKEVSVTGFRLETGASIKVKFANTNTAANPTLNVGDTGAKAIYSNGSAISAGMLSANTVIEFVYDGTNYNMMGDGGGGQGGSGECGVRLADVTDVGYEALVGRVEVTWTDPDDVSYQGASLARWAGTKLVRKTGSAPANENDGTLVVDNTTKNAYSTTAYVDSGLVDGTMYYYRLFPYTDVGSHTAGTSFSAAPNKYRTTMTVTKDTDAYTVAGGIVEVATITTDGDGVLVATSSDETIGIASLSNGKVVVEPVSEGTITVTVRQLAGLEWSSAGPETISIDCGFASTTLGDNSPAVIANIIKSGQAANLWNVGDKVGITLNGTVGQLTFNNETFYASILGFDHNKDVESGGAHNVHFIFGKTANNVDICFVDSGYNTHQSEQSGANYFQHHTSATNKNGWSGSDLRTMCNGAFLSCMPAEWQAVIGSSTKYSNNTGGRDDTASNVTATQDKLFLLAEWEVFGVRTKANSAEKNYQQQYDYYKNGNSKIRYKHNSTSSAAYWHLRSASTTDAVCFCVVLDSGNVSSSVLSPQGFAPGFAIF